jgi:hypothetical protein
MTMNFLQTFYLNIDAFLIYFYRIVEQPLLDYFIGTGILSLLCVIIGEFTLSVAFRFNKAFIDQDSREMTRMQNLSLRALLAKDKQSYKAFNREANEAFGKVFFKQIALAAASLWPIPFALGWMQTRFMNIEFLLPCRLPVVGETVGYSFTFIPMYILAHILFGKIKHKLPYFKTTEKMLASYKEDSDKMMTLSDLTEASNDNNVSDQKGYGLG